MTIQALCACVALAGTAGLSAVAVSPDFVGVRTLPAVSNADGTLTVTLPVALLKAYTLVRIGGAAASEGVIQSPDPSR